MMLRTGWAGLQKAYPYNKDIQAAFSIISSMEMLRWLSS
jgi:hypothetical protein